MKMLFSGAEEKKRLEERAIKPKWEYLETTNIVEALHHARDMGWKEDKVQVRYVTMDRVTTYLVEPFEKNCGCRGILKYMEYFD
jgi:hypothetical protein